MPFFNSDIYYSTHGRGNTALILIHGWYQNGSQAWGALVPHLESKYRLFVPDLPGHGLSPLTHDLTMERNDALIQNFIHHVKKTYRCKRIVLAGHSYGAFAVQRVIAVTPKSVDAAVAMAAIDDYSPYTKRLISILRIPYLLVLLYYRIQALLGLFPYGDRMLLYANMPEQLVPGRLAYAKIKNHILSIRNSHAYMRAFLGARVAWPGAKLAIPSLLVYGERDTLTHKSWAQKILPHLQKGGVVVIPDAGHNVQISGALVVARHMIDFIEKSFHPRTIK